METKEERKKQNKFVNFLYVNKKEIGAVLGSIALVIGIGLGVRSCSGNHSDNDINTDIEQPDNSNSNKKEITTKDPIKKITIGDVDQEKKEDESNLVPEEDVNKTEEENENSTENTNQKNSEPNSNNKGNDDSGSKKPNNSSTDQKPSKPNKPSTPEKPSKPDKPDKPDKPGKPDEPDKPGKPDEPDKPGKPDEPDKPKPHVHSLVSDYEAHDENEKCVITRWQVCTDSSCPDGAGTHLNESVERTSHQYTKISESEIAPDLWEITDKCTVCNHTQSYFMDSSELGYSQISNIETEEYILDFSTNTVYLKEEIEPIKEKQKTLSL